MVRGGKRASRARATEGIRGEGKRDEAADDEGFRPGRTPGWVNVAIGRTFERARSRAVERTCERARARGKEGRRRGIRS